MLFKLLKHFDRSRFDIQVISLTSLGEIGPKIEALGVPVNALGMKRGAFSALKFGRLIRLLRQSQPDIVQTWMYHADLLGGVAARLAGCRAVIWGLRNSDLSPEINSSSLLIVVKLCAALSRYVPMRILSCSNRGVSVHTEVGYMREKMQVIPNGFELDQFLASSSAKPSLCEELSIATNSRLVGLMARYDPQKNHTGFLRAASMVAESLPDVHFILAGTGVDNHNLALQTAIGELGLVSRCHLLGRRDDMPRLMAALDVLASSSSYGEAFPNVLGEAMACGVPCVVTDVGDSAEIVGNTGRVVPAGDMEGLGCGLLELLGLRVEQKAALGEQARARIAGHYEIGHVARLYQEFYERLAGSRKLGRSL